MGEEVREVKVNERRENERTVENKGKRRKWK